MASHDILINWTPQETRVAIVENAAVQELHIERALERGLVGNIYMGRVARVLPGMQSAFVEVGLERAAFLHVADLQVNAGARGAGAARSEGGNGDTDAPPLSPRAAPAPRAPALTCRSATCRNAARSSPTSTNADCMPGSTRTTRPA